MSQKVIILSLRGSLTFIEKSLPVQALKSDLGHGLNGFAQIKINIIYVSSALISKKSVKSVSN